MYQRISPSLLALIVLLLGLVTMVAVHPALICLLLLPSLALATVLILGHQNRV